MDGGSDKGSNVAEKTGGSSVNLTESMEVEQGGVHREHEMEAEEVKSSEPTVEGSLLEENKASVKAQEEETRKIKEKKASPTTVTPVLIFPVEVWEQILRELEDSEDILNVFRAFSYLDGQVPTLANKYWWLFDQVVPHLRPWLSNEVLLSCRLVCKRWDHGVENHLEKLPFRTGVKYHRQRLITGQVWYPKGAKGYYDYKLRLRDNIGCGVSFKNTGQLTQFLQHVDKHPSSRNPFLGRSVKFQISETWRNDQAEYQNTALETRRMYGDDIWLSEMSYQNAATEILRIHGHHVSFVELFYEGKNFRQLLRDVALLLPNLKTLRVDGVSYHDNKSDGSQEGDGRELFPVLSKLKSLDARHLCHIDGTVIPRNFVNPAKLQRLSISQKWMRECGAFFPELRELNLVQIDSQDILMDQLTSLKASNLSKLSLYMTTLEQHAPSCIVKLDDILSWIKLFPRLEDFELRVGPHEWSGCFEVVGPPIFDCVPSIKSIFIHWENVYLLGPAFLRCFPSLEYAILYDTTRDKFSWQKWVVSKNLYDWNLWGELPSLKEISFHSWTRSYAGLGLPTHHNRGTYEWLKKEKQRERKERQRSLSDEELRECIVGFDSMIGEEVDFSDGTVPIFPEEVWELILRKLDDSQDVINAFKAYSNLEGLVYFKNKYLWQFDQVVPHLRPWIKNGLLLSCRLVCKKWAHAVENHLETLQRVVDHKRPITGHVPYPEGSQAHLHYKLRPLDKIGCTFGFDYHNGLSQFFREMANHPPSRNPFLGRSLKVTSNRDNPAHFIPVMEILRKLGHHLWFLTLDYSGENFCQLVIDVISLVPNLKGIELEWWPHSDEVFSEDQRALFPHLPQLESLMFHKHMPPNFMNFLVTSYSAQIKSLSINKREWRRNSLTRFPNLRELRLREVFCHDVDDAVEFLTDFGSPVLTKLCLEVIFQDSDWRLTDILSLISPFPKLQHFGLQITGGDRSSHYIREPVLDRVTSIKSLSISWTKAHLLASELLRWFPSLEYANIDAHDNSYKYQRDRSNENVYLWEVWKEIPSLKEVNFCPYPGLPRHYNRINYEWLKKQREGPPRPLTDKELQDCIEGFESMLSGTWGNEEEDLEEGYGHQVEFSRYWNGERWVCEW